MLIDELQQKIAEECLPYVIIYMNNILCYFNEIKSYILHFMYVIIS